MLDTVALPDEALIRIYTQDQGGVERGFAFLKDPLFLASSVFLKKPERIVALSGVMVLCLLVYRLAEHRLRQQLAATGQSIPNQIHKPTARPTMRWVFHDCHSSRRPGARAPPQPAPRADPVPPWSGVPRNLPSHQLTMQNVAEMVLKV